MSDAVVSAPKPEPARKLTMTDARQRDWPRRFFTGLGVFCLCLVVVGFGPNFYRSLTGDLFVPPITYVHAAIMVGWVAVYTRQASLAASGNLTRHRRDGWLAMAWAAAVWIFMGVAILTALHRLDPDRFGFIVKPILVGLGTMVLFPIFVIWAVLARRHANWHKRLMTFATFTLVQAALDRMSWLPDEGLPMFWHAGLRGYILLLLPLFIFDVLTLKRLHRATVIGSILIVTMHATVSFYWDHDGWNHVARAFWIWVRG